MVLLKLALKLSFIYDCYKTFSNIILEKYHPIWHALTQIYCDSSVQLYFQEACFLSDIELN